MRMALTKKRGLYLLVVICCAVTIYFYPFMSSSITWMRHSHFRYENRTEVKLPYRWVAGEGGGLVLEKPPTTITSFTSYMFRSVVFRSGMISSDVFQNTRLSVSDSGPNFKPDDQGRVRVFHAFRLAETRDTPDELTYPFTSACLLCSPINKRTTKPSDMLFIICYSSDFRYSLEFMGREKDIREASEIAKQVVR
jgi:hypothetical protein